MSAVRHHCDACDHFWVADSTDTCPNCGNVDPAQTPSVAEARLALALSRLRLDACRNRLAHEGPGGAVVAAIGEALDERRRAIVDLGMAYLGGRP